MTVQPHENHFETKNMLWLEVTNFCNLSCTHCYNVSGPGRPMEPSIGVGRYIDLLREARDMGFQRVQFIGGEPLFYPHLSTLVSSASGTLGFDEIEIYSNLTHLPDWLFYEPYRSIKIATSFYSDDPAVHDWICGARGAYRRTLASLKRLVEAGSSIRVGYIEMAANEGHFERTREFLARMGITEVGYDTVREFGRAERSTEPSLTELCGHCAAGNLSVDVDGNVSGCIMSKPWTFGSVHKSNLRELFGSEQRRKFINDLAHNLEQREPPAPMLCDPYGQGQCGPTCAPACGPHQSCNPCSPLGSRPCNPNGRCGPF